MELQLKHLAAYLPYGLNWEIEVTNENASFGKRNDKMQTLSTDDFGIVTFEKEADYYLDGSNDNICKPILRPLSDLTKEIEVNGENFVPIVELAKIRFTHLTNPKICLMYHSNAFRKHDWFGVRFEDPTREGWASDRYKFVFHCDQSYFTLTQENSKSRGICNVQFQNQLFQKLYEWHFDVFSLIENNLAIKP